MTEPFLGEIRMFSGTFAPRSWALCEGQLVAISQNESLYSLLGTTYGGDGRSNFALPDMRGRLPVHYGTGPGLTERRIGQRSGRESALITIRQLPGHTHGLMASNAAGDNVEPTGRNLGTPGSPAYGPRSSKAAKNVTLADIAVSAVGGGQAHDNMMPALCINFIISLAGVYPSRS